MLDIFSYQENANKTTVRYLYLPTRLAKRDDNEGREEDVGHLKCSYCWRECKMEQRFRNNLVVCYKWKYAFIISPTNPTPT